MQQQHVSHFARAAPAHLIHISIIVKAALMSSTNWVSAWARVFPLIVGLRLSPFHSAYRDESPEVDDLSEPTLSV